jgi:phosphoglycerate dehydrogenase-like enzyme
MPAGRPRAAFLLDPATAEAIYSPEEMRQLSELLDLCPEFIAANLWRDRRETLASCEIILSGWGAPRFDKELLEAMPGLRAVFYAGGTVKAVVNDEFWKHGIVLSTCNAANAIPVAEFAVAQIVLLLKDAHRFAATMRERRGWVDWWPVAGAFGSTVGLVSLSTIGRLVAEKLRAFEVNVIAFDPVAKPALFKQLGVRPVTLPELFKTSHVVSVHAPLLPETTGLIDHALLKSMRRGAAFLNTARGAIVDQQALTRVLEERPDLFAMLDVTWPKPPPPDSKLYDLPNVVITPHIAGSMSAECRRMGRMAIGELRRYLNKEPLRHRITKDMLARMA